jgi:hypothetical protein
MKTEKILDKPPELVETRPTQRRRDRREEVVDKGGHRDSQMMSRDLAQDLSDGTEQNRGRTTSERQRHVLEDLQETCFRISDRECGPFPTVRVPRDLTKRLAEVPFKKVGDPPDLIRAQGIHVSDHGDKIVQGR